MVLHLVELNFMEKRGTKNRPLWSFNEDGMLYNKFTISITRLKR